MGTDDVNEDRIGSSGHRVSDESLSQLHQLRWTFVSESFQQMVKVISKESRVDDAPARAWNRRRFSNSRAAATAGWAEASPPSGVIFTAAGADATYVGDSRPVRGSLCEPDELYTFLPAQAGLIVWCGRYRHGQLNYPTVLTKMSRNS